MDFNESQLAAIRHKDGPMMVLAGPGSGKTAVITRRTQYLIEEGGVNPSNILVITFTKAAAMEMKQRFCKLMQQDSVRVTFGTFHAVFFMVLRAAYHMQSSNIVTDEQKYQFMREIISHKELDYSDEKDTIGGLLSEISMVKNSRIELEHFYSAQAGEEIFREIYREYDMRLRKNRLIDFDDMLTYTYELFSERADILGAWQRKYRYILIDEFQDINPIQYDIMRMLAAPENNLFIVGDDDQSIYRFRGSKPEIMLNFGKDYPDAKQVLLNYNYRCDGYVVQESLKLIAHNKARFEKEIRNAKETKNRVEYRTFEDQRQENKYLITIIRRSVQGETGIANNTNGANASSMADNVDRANATGIANAVNRANAANVANASSTANAAHQWHYRDFAILFRTNSQPRQLIEALMGYNIPFRMKEHVPNLYEHWIARDIFTYLNIVHGSRERKDFLTIMNRPKRYIGRDSLTDSTVDFAKWSKFYADKEWIADRIERLEYDVRIMANMSPYAAINYIRKSVGYDEFLKEYAQFRRINPEDLFDVMEELHATAKGYKSYSHWQEHIREYAAELRKASELRNENPDAVMLATLHGSKGLEFPQVFLIDANEGLMPYKKAVLDADVEEERRMFYVGMTRAIDRLYIFTTRQINGKDAAPSRFVAEAQGRAKK